MAGARRARRDWILGGRKREKKRGRRVSSLRRVSFLAWLPAEKKDDRFLLVEEAGQGGALAPSSPLTPPVARPLGKYVDCPNGEEESETPIATLERA